MLTGMIRPLDLIMTSVVAGALALAIAGSAGAQQLNQRKTADPAADAKLSRMSTRGALQAAKQGGDTLKNDDLSDMAVHTDCGPVQIGGTQTAGPGDSKEKESLLRKRTSEDDESTTLVPGDVVVICRR